jgi:hypothetical protein
VRPRSYDPPGWVRPERLPDDLPPQEQWVRMGWQVMGAPAKHPPQTAPGFQRAQRLGLLPPLPPEQPPTPLPGLAASLQLALALVVFVSPLLLVAVLDMESWQGWIVPGYGVIAFFGALRLFASLERRAAAEAAAGYTTFWLSPGLWRLTPFGRPVRPPDRRHLPDGFYPSPYWPGVLQKWEGVSWKPLLQYWWRTPEQWFRTPPVNYLDPWR